jgi:hypothetical protein
VKTEDALSQHEGCLLQYQLHFARGVNVFCVFRRIDGSYS